MNGVTVSGKPCKTTGQYILVCLKGDSCGPIKSMGSVTHVVVAGGVLGGFPGHTTSFVEIYNVKESSWAAGKVQSTHKRTRTSCFSSTYKEKTFHLEQLHMQQPSLTKIHFSSLEARQWHIIIPLMTMPLTQSTSMFRQLMIGI